MIAEFLLGVHEASLFTILLKSFEKFFENLNRITLAVLFLIEVIENQASLTFSFPHCTYVNKSENYNEALFVL